MHGWNYLGKYSTTSLMCPKFSRCSISVEANSSSFGSCFMSVQFGRWSFVGESPEPEYVKKVSACIAPYGPDTNESYSGDGIRILYRAFHTTKEARYEKQPHICRSGV